MSDQAEGGDQDDQLVPLPAPVSAEESAALVDGPVVRPPAGVSVFEWALHVSQALQLTAQNVADWQREMGVSRLPTLEELQWPPFNCTVEFAWRFLRWATAPDPGASE